MIEVRDVPIIEWQIRWLKSFGIAEFIVCVGYMKERIIDYLGSGSRLGIKIGYAVEEDPLGTGGALKNAETLLSGQSSFFLLNGDILTELDPNRLKQAKSHAIALVPLRSPFGVVEINNSDSRVIGFTEKPKIPDKWVNAGLYYFTPEIFQYLPENGNIETTALPTLAREGKLTGVRYENTMWRSIDSHKDIEEAAKELHAAKVA